MMDKSGTSKTKTLHNFQRKLTFGHDYVVFRIKRNLNNLKFIITKFEIMAHLALS